MRVGRSEADVDFYRVLGLGKGATIAEIRQAHRRLVLAHHPDRQPAGARAEAEAKLKLINQGAALLLDPTTRARYDELRSERELGDVPKRTARSTTPSRAEPVAADASGWSTPGGAGWSVPGPAIWWGGARPRQPRGSWKTLVGAALLVTGAVFAAAQAAPGPVPVSSSEYRVPKAPERVTMFAE
jgi:curved DNA-binding protein CbpA